MFDTLTKLSELSNFTLKNPEICLQKSGGMCVPGTNKVLKNGTVLLFFYIKLTHAIKFFSALTELVFKISVIISSIKVFFSGNVRLVDCLHIN
ncbi:hypothetical protein EBME_0772 [bacterium endosymbiont of Mortierella elongata FMR23-6]|nr:hypothetical protein EBME_0772 [bacterium endosymbiont of Mortierella elongata FMR23-6]